MASFSSQAQNFCVVQGASNVCPNNEVTYNVQTGGVIFNDQLKITITGGIITNISNAIPSGTTISADRKSATVFSIQNPVDDSQVTVRWDASGGSGKIAANVRFNLGLLGGYQYNSDEINVINGVSNVGAISGVSTISCGVSSSMYSVNPVLGASSYVWQLNGANVGSGTSVSISPSSVNNGANLQVIAYSSDCNVSKSSTKTIYKTAATGKVLGFTSVMAASSGTYRAIDASNSQILAGSNFNWSVSSPNWAITDGQGTSEIVLQAPDLTSVSTNLSYTAIDACGNFVSGTAFIKTKSYKLEGGRVANLDFSLFPNPSQDDVTLACGTKETGTLKIFDKLGIEIAQFANVVNGFTFNVAKFPTDTYTVQFITESTVKTFRLSVNHN